MTDHDERIRRRYRELAREEPPSALDDAIARAAHRAVRRPRSRWAGPLSIAAVIVLAVGITLRMQRDEPGVETSMPDAGRASTPAPAPAQQPAPSAPPPSRPSVETAPSREAVKRERPMQPPAKPQAPQPGQPLPEMARVPEPFPRTPPAAPPPEPSVRAPAQAADMAPAPAANASAGAAAVAQKRMAAPADARDVELERIAKLRESGKDAEADEALARFRRDHPDYAIPAALWERVRPR